ncbi:TonB-dependent receptor [Aquimarina algiphila]|uniref:TonB-dependent receptor n=1 Tax=Aquimarina algiphila TaxID=2047982 RepID=A0A554VQ71_9FLAO|nr:TonB-dependent receptor [Aquimarina algiphila]TSE10674.1 TonB-dependent receptor [Aquimarina algiphila]
MKRYLVFFILLQSTFVISQTGSLKGSITSNNKQLPFATIEVFNTSFRTSSSSNGEGFYEVKNIPAGNFTVKVSLLGFQTSKEEVAIIPGESTIKKIELEEDRLNLDQIVISATRNRVNRKKAPVVVNVLNPQLLNATQSISLSDGLNYSPGVRVENNCQNCGFTQVRLNGLDGSYTQVLVNSRAVFSALNNVYGLEQIPTNIVERIEVVRSGGSALYGSNAIAGTINIITKDPVLNTWEIGSYFGLIDGDVPDRLINFNSSLVSDDLMSGITLFGLKRDREEFDANDDGFSELTTLSNTTFGIKTYLKPNERSKISLDLTTLKEFRRGGDRLDLAPHFTDITEQLDHDTFLGGITYDLQNKNLNSNFSVYTSGQYTERGSFYGGLGGSRTQQDSILALNSYGTTKDLALVSGAQYTYNFKNEDIITVGVEYNLSDTEDIIPGYDRLIDQNVNTIGSYAQYEWKPNDNLTALVGTRLDHVNVKGDYNIGGISREVSIEQTVLSPRLTLSYNITEALKFRGGYARGFRTPQAFNEDLHVSSVGGEPQFVILSEDLNTEYSNAYTTSFNYSKNFNKVQTDILIEGFYTDLQDPFTLVSTGAVLENGSILEEVRNGSGANVFGTNLEIGISPSKEWQFQIGGTIQKAEYDEAQILFETDGTIPNETDVSVDEFVRNPNSYGYFNTSWIPGEHFNMDLTGTYTGSMTIPRVVSPSGFLDLVDSDSFFDVNIKLEYHTDISENFQMTFSGGIKNIFDNYQDDFDIGPLRDSDYIYGPGAPRTFFIGIKFGKLH